MLDVDMHSLLVCLENTSLTNCVYSLLHQIERDAHNLYIIRSSRAYTIIAVH